MSRKVVQHRFGGPEVLEVVEVPDPTADDLATDEVLVRVTFAGINPVDRKTRGGDGAADALGDLPFTVGWDLAGTVVSVGAAAGGLEVGQRVFGMARFPHQAAAYAQFAVVPAVDLVAIPESLSDEAAAALPLAALTAWQDLVDIARLQRGHRVLIQGAGGGVGHLAVQIAHHFGAEVIVTASSGKHGWLKELGAGRTIDYTREDVVDALADDPVDVVFDLISGPVAAQSVAVTRRGGLVIDLPGHMDDETHEAADAAGVRVESPLVHTDRPGMEHIADLAGAGTLVVTVSAVYDLDDVADAHRALEEGHISGKVVLRAW